MSSADLIVSALEDFVALVVRKLVLDIVANLTASPSEGGTPVDTGWARSNWIPRIGKTFEGTSGTREAVSAGAQESGKAQVLTYKLDQGPVHITNNVPYIVFLNDGSSKQAPRGFVQAAIERAVSQFGKTS